MNREQEYRLLADNAFKRAVEEESAQLIAQWKILGAKYLELADQSKNIDARDTPNGWRSRFGAGPPDDPARLHQSDNLLWSVQSFRCRAAAGRSASKRRRIRQYRTS